MQHARSLAEIELTNSWLTIGTFDGVHRGHQTIIHRLVTGANSEGQPAVVVTFDPHPAVILGKRQEPMLLTTPDERAQFLSELGVDLVVSHPFNRTVAKMTAREFIASLKEHLGFRHLIIGYDFALGRNREGDRHRLRELGGEFDYQLEAIQPLTNDNLVVSSSEIRRALQDGRLDKANNLLGRLYQLPGKVIPGDGRGRTIGVPTANLNIPELRLIPRKGVYVCKANLAGKDYGAVTNIGIRPTFETENPAPHVETHLFDFNGDLYGTDIVLKFVDRLRDERRFESVDALVSQIHTDIQSARMILQSTVL